MNDKLSIFLNGIVRYLPFSTPFIFIYLTALITAVALKKKLRLSDRLIIALAAVLAVDIIFPLVHVYVTDVLRHTSELSPLNIAYVFMVLGLIRTVTASVLLAVILYDLVITRFNLLPVEADQQPKVKRIIQLTFNGDAFSALKYILLLLVSSITIIPMAWAVAGLNRWLVSSVSPRDGQSKTTFQGTGNQIWPYFVGIWLIAIGPYALTILVGFASGNIGDGRFAFMSLYPALLICLMPLTIFWSFKILTWSINSISTEQGVHPEFEGRYISLVGYNLLLAVSYLSVIGWAWVNSSILRWLCRSVRINGYRVRFVAKGHQVLGVYLAYSMGCLLIVTIPFLTVWFCQWHIKHMEIDELEQAVATS